MSQNHTENLIKDDPSKNIFNNNNKKTIIHTRLREEAPAQEYPENRIQKKHRRTAQQNNTPTKIWEHGVLSER